MQGIVVTHLTVMILSVIRVIVRLRQSSGNSVVRFTDWLSLTLTEFRLTLRLSSEFFTGETQRHCRQRRSLCHLWWQCRCLSLVNRGTHLRLHGTYQTSHGRPHCPILMSLLLSQIPGNAQQQWTVLNLKQHCHTANNAGPWMSDRHRHSVSDSRCHCQSHCC